MTKNDKITNDVKMLINQNIVKRFLKFQSSNMEPYSFMEQLLQRKLMN